MLIIVTAKQITVDYNGTNLRKPKFNFITFEASYKNGTNCEHKIIQGSVQYFEIK